MNRVMLVDDDRALRYVYSKMGAWTKYGFSVCEEASNGIQALEKIQSDEISVVFADIRMPFMDGISMMKRMKEQYPELIFVLVSSYHEFEYAREGLRMGAFDYLVKPLEEAELENVLMRLRKIMDGKERIPAITELLDGIVPEVVDWSDPVLVKLCGILDEDRSHNFTLEEVASRMNLNRDYFGKIIKMKTGMNYKNLNNELKIAYAKMMIESGDYKVYEISEKIGYSSADYFSKLFRASTGVTPAEYKKSQNRKIS